MYKYIYYCPVSYANRRCCLTAALSLRLTLKNYNYEVESLSTQSRLTAKWGIRL